MNSEKKYSLEELEVDLKDMFLQLLKRWRSIIVFALVLGLLGGTFSYIKSSKAYSAQQTKTEAAKKKGKDEKKETIEKNPKENIIEVLEQTYQNNNEYMINSARMQLNLDGYYEGSLTYIVSADHDEDTVYQLYRKKTDNSDVWDKICEIAKEDKKADYYKTLLEIKKIPKTLSESGNADAEADGKTLFVIKFSHNDKTICENVIKMLEEEVTSVQDDIAKTGGTHTLELFSKEVFLTQSRELVQERQGLAENQATLARRINDLKNELPEDESYIKIEDAPYPSADIRFIILGILAGGILAVAWYIFLYLADGRVHTKKDVLILTGEDVLAVYKVPGKRKIFSGIDKWVDGLISQRDGFGNSLEMLKFRLEEYAKIADAKEICVVGSCIKSDQSVAEIASKLESEKVSLKIAYDFLENPKERESVLKNGHVVLVEKIGKTTYTALMEETRLLHGSDTEMAGVILLR